MTMAPEGHPCAHFVQPMQSSVIEYLVSARQRAAGQRPATCASYSERKYRSVVMTGLGAVLPRPQRLPFLTSRAHRLVGGTRTASAATHQPNANGFIDPARVGAAGQAKCAGHGASRDDGGGLEELAARTGGFARLVG